MKRHPRIALAVEMVCANFSIDPETLYKYDRHKSVTVPRQMAFWVARQLSHPSFSYEEIAVQLNRDYSTVYHGIRRFERARDDDAYLRDMSDRIVKAIMTPDRFRVA